MSIDFIFKPTSPCWECNPFLLDDCVYKHVDVEAQEEQLLGALLKVRQRLQRAH